MGCVKLLKGLDISCSTAIGAKYYQQVVLINRSDVDEVLIKDAEESHRISFNLKGTSSGVMFKGVEAGRIFNATFDKSERKGIPYYQHRLELPVVGVKEEIKVLLKQLDIADFFAAVQYKDETVEIFGFNNGLKTGNYSYEAQGGIGGATIPLESRYEEYVPPYIYYGRGNETQHFNDLFANLPPVLGGDFNDDFSNDFYITQV